MLELLLTTAVFAAAIMSLRGRNATDTPQSADATADLPCPWCEAATTERDAQCPNCRQPFGHDRRTSEHAHG